MRGYAHFAGIDDYAGRECELRFQNEHLLAKSGDEVLCSAPDLIAVLDIETALPITTEGMVRVAWLLAFLCTSIGAASAASKSLARVISATTSISFPLRNALSKARTSSRFFWMSQRGSGVLKVPGFDVSRSGLAAVFGNGKLTGSNALRKLASA